MRHLLFTPPSPDTRGDWPLIVFLHGSGERGDDLSEVARYGLPRYLSAGRRIPSFAVAPQCPAGLVWTDVLEPLTEMLAELMSAHPIARERVLLTGFSLGGFGAWDWAMLRPHDFAALVPVAGSRCGPDSYPAGADIGALRAMPIWMFHGARDRQVPVEGADRCAAALEQSNTKLRYTRYPDVGHRGTCRRAFSNPELYDWLMNQRTEPR